MRAVVQRVRSASVDVDGRTTARIARGLLVFVAVGRDDVQVDIDYIANKIRTLRLFEDNEGKMNRSLTDVGGTVLVVSEFTLFGDCRRGRRPSFDGAAPPSAARAVYDMLIDALRTAGVRVEVGVFRAMMEIKLVNDGPVTVLLDSARSF